MKKSEYVFCQEEAIESHIHAAINKIHAKMFSPLFFKIIIN